MFRWPACCLTANTLTRDTEEEEKHLWGQTLAEMSSSRTSRWQTDLSEHAATCLRVFNMMDHEKFFSLQQGREISRALYSERSEVIWGGVNKTNDFGFGTWRRPPPCKTLASVISLLCCRASRVNMHDQTRQTSFYRATDIRHLRRHNTSQSSKSQVQKIH